MAHIPVDCRSLTIILSFVLLFSLLSISTNARGDDNNQIVHQLSIDGDNDAYKQWDDWSYYYNSSSGQIEHNRSYQYTEDGTQLLLFNSEMHHKAEGGGWEFFDGDGTTFTIRNMVKYAVGVTMFSDSSINIENCREVVLGDNFDYPVGNKDIKDGYLINTQVVVSNFEKLWIYNYTYTKSGGEPITIIGNGHSTVIIDATYNHKKQFKIYPSVLSNSPGMIVRDVEWLEFDSWYNPVIIANHTPDMVLENIKDIDFANMPSGNSYLILDNKYYSVSDAKWERGGTGIVTKNVSKVIGDSGVKQIIIRNCNIGIAFEDNGTGEGLNNSPYVKFVNCTHNYAYEYSYTSLPAGLGDLIVGFQALTGVFVAIAWFRVGVYYVSERREKKEMAKDMMQKASIGSIIVAIVAYGYPIMVGMVNWIFGG